MDYIREAIESLKDYNRLVVAEKNITEQIEALTLERDNIKSQKLSFAPGGSSSELPDDKIANNIFKRKMLYKNLEITKKRIACMDRAFATLEENEAEVLNRLFVIGGKKGVEDLMETLHYERSQVYNIRNEAIRKFSRALYGIGAA